MGSTYGQAVFEHDCDTSCQFLGHRDGHDLYVHRAGVCPTYVARYGNDGPDYISGVELVGINPHVSAAHDLALAAGLALPLAVSSWA